MNRLLAHARSNVIGYLALFVALGGTSYAAVNLPAGSVGNRQVRNHSITPIKFDRSTIGGYVRYWAKIDSAGEITASRPRAHLVGWSDQPGDAFPGGLVSWGRAVPPRCFALATTATLQPPTPGGSVASYATVEIYSAGNKNGPDVGAKVLLSAPQVAVNVAVICAQP
ncbi:MAG: hypothetical protein ACR2OB_02720 [Solirubrobacteraceae bacterium]